MASITTTVSTLALASLTSSILSGITSATSKNSGWGIYDKSGNLFLTLSGSSIIGTIFGTDSQLTIGRVDFAADAKVAEFPVAANSTTTTNGVGSFASYNKVENPFAFKVQLLFQGTNTDRVALFTKLEKLRLSTDLYNIITPGLKGQDCTLEAYSYARTPENVSVLKIDTTWRKIRTVSSKNTKTSSSSATSTADSSSVSIGSATSSVSSAASSALGKVQAATSTVSTLKSLYTSLSSSGSSLASTVKGYLQ